MVAAALALALAAEEAAPHCSSFDLSVAGIGSLEEELARTAGLAGSAPLWPGVLRRPSSARPLWLCDGPAPGRSAVPDPEPLPMLRWDLVPPASLGILHTGWADDRNDGALWAGRGLSADVSVGVRARWRWFTAQLAPLAAWQQNRAYRIPASAWPGQSPYANPFNYGVIDLPLQMGPSSFSTFDWGQSYLRADAWGLAVGLSTENLWWGPGIRNSLLMTNTAPGFPHVFVGTSRPVDVWIGWLEFEALWGQVSDSKWLHSDGRIDRRLIDATVLTFAPAFQPNLTLGMGEVDIFPNARQPFNRYFDTLLPPILQWISLNTRSSFQDNRLAVLFFRWAFPASRFELYGEWGRDDWPASVTAGIIEPGYSQAFAFGLQKLFPARRGWVRLQAEMTHTLEIPPVHPEHQTAIFYTHSDGTGYTNAGQMLGAGLGPQGDTQFLAADWFRGAGYLGLFMERVLRNDRWFYDQITAPTSTARHDVEMTFGTRGAWAYREWDLQWEVGFSHRYDMAFLGPAGGVDARLSLRWWPGRAEAPALPLPSSGPGLEVPAP